MRRSEDSLNEKFGKLTVVEILPADKYGNKKAHCQCECGGSKITTIHKLRRQEVRSCGCLRSANSLKQLSKASKNNPKLNKKHDPKEVTARIQFAKRYADGDLTYEQFLELSQQNCYYCGSEPANLANAYKQERYSELKRNAGYFKYNGLDRVNNELPHNFSNVVPCCIACNKAKLNRTQSDFLIWIRKVYALHN